MKLESFVLGQWQTGSGPAVMLTDASSGAAIAEQERRSLGHDGEARKADDGPIDRQREGSRGCNAGA